MNPYDCHFDEPQDLFLNWYMVNIVELDLHKMYKDLPTLLQKIAKSEVCKEIRSVQRRKYQRVIPQSDLLSQITSELGKRKIVREARLIHERRWAPRMGIWSQSMLTGTHIQECTVLDDYMFHVEVDITNRWLDKMEQKDSVENLKFHKERMSSTLANIKQRSFKEIQLRLGKLFQPTRKAMCIIPKFIEFEKTRRLVEERLTTYPRQVEMASPQKLEPSKIINLEMLLMGYDTCFLD